MKRLASGAGLAILIAAILFRRPLQQLIKSVPLPARPAFGLSRLNKDELYRRAQEKDIGYGGFAGVFAIDSKNGEIRALTNSIIP